MPAQSCADRECKGLIIKGKEERAWGVEKGEPSAVSVILDITVIYGGKGLENIVAILRACDPGSRTVFTIEALRADQPAGQLTAQLPSQNSSWCR